MTVDPGSEPWTARRVKAALYHHFTGRYAVLTELVHDSDEAMAYAKARDASELDALGGLFPSAWERRVDVLLVSKTERIAVEVKVSRGDFLADVRDPAKQATWRGLAHRHAYAVPPGLVTVDEVPADSGLIVVRDTGYPRAKWERRAPKGHAAPDLPARVLHTIMHRCARAEALAKGLLPGESEDPETLRLALDRARADLDLVRGELDRARARAESWRRAYAAQGDPPCAFCGQPIRPRWGKYGEKWEHRNPDHEPPCVELRVAGATSPPADPLTRRFYAEPIRPVDSLSE